MRIALLSAAWLMAVSIDGWPSLDVEATQLNPNSPSGSPKLDCSVELAGQQLKVKVNVTNPGTMDIFVLNRLWDLNSAGQIVADPENVYRFVRSSELRLLWGVPPAPRLKSVTYRNIPFATPVKPSGSLKWEHTLDLPLKEYSVYFPEGESKGYKPAPVNRVVVVVEYVQGRLATTPTSLNPAVKVPTPEALDSRHAMTCASKPLQLEILRHTEEFSRFTMPNEAQEPLVMAK